MNVVHLHTDQKFIYESERFLAKEFNNTIIYYSPNNDSLSARVKNKFNVKHLKNDNKLFNEITSLLSSSNANVLVLYDLDPTKIAFVNQLKLSVKVIWRFFGHELYMKNKEYYLTDSTIKISKNVKVGFFTKVYNFYKYRKNLLTKKLYLNYNLNFDEALSKIDGFMCIYEEEYKFLVQTYGPLPRYINIPLDEMSIPSSPLNAVSSKILIGNSRNDFNNHYDILEILISQKDKYVMPFSYGSVNYYSKYIKEVALSKRVQVLDQFMEYEKYDSLISSCTTLVSNTKRQMAVGNILLGINKGLKIYLNEQNSLFSFFMNNKIKCFPIAALKEDVENDNLQLTAQEKIINIEAFNLHCRTNSYSKFLKSITEL